MNSQNNQIVKVFALSISVTFIGGAVWLLGTWLGEVLWTLSLGSSQSNPDRSLSSESIATTSQLTLLGDTFSGYSTFRNREFKQDLKELNVDLVYEDEFNQIKRAELLNQGQADVIVTTLDQFLKQKPKGKIVGLIDTTVGADAIVLNTKKYPNLNSLENLTQLVREKRKQGKYLSITYAENTPSEFLLSLVLSTKFDAFKLSDFDVKEVVDASIAWRLLQDPKENIALGVIWEPYVTQARKQGYTVVLSSQDAPRAIVDVIVASNRAIESQPQKIAQLLEAYYRRLDANIRQPSRIQEQIAEDGKLSPDEAVAVLQGIDFFTSIEAKEWMTTDILEKRIASTAAVLVLTGKIKEIPENTQELFASNFINKPAKNTEALIALVRDDNPQLADRLAGKGTTIKVAQQTSPSQISVSPEIGILQFDGEIIFESGSAVLSEDSQHALDRLAQKISEFNASTVAVRVIGHTSRTGTGQINQTLSLERAEVVVEALRDRGLSHKFVAEGNGFETPLPDFSPKDPRQQRTEIRLVRIN